MVSQTSRKVLQVLSLLTLSLALAAQAQPSVQVVDLNTTEEQETLEGIVDQRAAPLGSISSTRSTTASTGSSCGRPTARRAGRSSLQTSAPGRAAPCRGP